MVWAAYAVILVKSGLARPNCEEGGAKLFAFWSSCFEKPAEETDENLLATFEMFLQVQLFL